MHVLMVQYDMIGALQLQIISTYYYIIIISNDAKHFIQRRIAIEQCFDPTKVFTRHKTVLYSSSFCLQHFVKTSN